MFPFYAHAQGDLTVIKDIDRIGLYDTSSEGKLGGEKGLWDGYSQQKALDTINRLPSRLSSPVYRNLVKQILLSSGPSSEESIESPAFLTRRLQLLINYGLIDEAKELYEAIPDSYNSDDDINMALIDLQFSLMDGDLAPACLDIQASSAQFKDMPEWKELSDYCRQRFSGSEAVNDPKVYFSLPNLLADKSINYSKLKDVEILLAQADNKLFKGNQYYNATRDIDNLSDLLILIASDSRYAGENGHQCYIIEAAERGLRDYNYVGDAYLKSPMDKSALSQNFNNADIPPCMAPAYFYQKIVLESEPEARNRIVNSMLQHTSETSPRALEPFIGFIEKADIDKEYHWRAASILALAGTQIPDDYLPVALPLQNLQLGRSIRQDEYISWLDNEFHVINLQQQSIDIAAPLYLLQIVNGEFNKLTKTTSENKYENIFSLTYAKNSLNLGLGFSGFMSGVWKQGDMTDLITRSLGLMANNNISDYSTEDAAVILSAFEAYKLEKESVLLALEYLQ